MSCSAAVMASDPSTPVNGWDEAMNVKQPFDGTSHAAWVNAGDRSIRSRCIAQSADAEILNRGEVTLDVLDNVGRRPIDQQRAHVQTDLVGIDHWEALYVRGPLVQRAALIYEFVNRV